MLRTWTAITVLSILANFLIPLQAIAAPVVAEDNASVYALPSWFSAPSHAATSSDGLPSWFGADRRSPVLSERADSSDQDPASGPHHTIYADDITVSGPTEVNDCDIVTFTITATDDGSGASNVVITSTMPTGFTPTQRVFTVGNVSAGETITREAVFSASCQAVSGQNAVTLSQDGGPTAGPIYTDFTVNPGAITLRKVPSVIPASVGDVVTWTVIVENTGYGRVDNVTVTDTLGAGLQFLSGDTSAFAPSLDPGQFLTFTVSALVTQCTDLYNDAQATWGCDGQTCQTHTAQASIDLQLDAPYLDYTLPNFDVDYCEGSGVFTIPVINTGLGTAHNVVLDTNMAPFSVTALSAGATYTPGVGFSLPDIGGESGYNLICELTAENPCGPTSSGGNFEFELEFDDDCGNPYRLPGKQQNWSLSGGVPSLGISKEMPGEIYLGEAVTPTIQVVAANVDYSPVIVTDTLPPGWTVVDPRGGNVFTDSGTTYITWTVSGNDTTVLTPVIRSPVVSVTDANGCDYCGYQAPNVVEVRATDCQTCTHYAIDDGASTYIQCEDILNSHDKEVAPAAAETCEGFVYTSTYVFAPSFVVTPTWQGMVFTDELPHQTYVPNSAGIQLQNGQSCDAVFSETVSNGMLVITNISPTCGITVPGTTMNITFQSSITAPSGCDDMTFYDWSHLNLGVTGNGICADDGLLEEGVFVSVDAPQMSLGIAGIPPNVEPCAQYPITLTLNRLGDAPAHDVALRFDTTDYAIIELLGFGGPTPYFTQTDALSYTWFYSDVFATETTAQVYLRVQRHCDAVGGADATAWYEGNCEDDDEYFEECFVNAGANPPELEPSLIVAKYPELYYADGDYVTWTLTLINSGPAVAHEVILTDTLGADLRYYTSTITATRGSVAGVIPDVSSDERLVTWTLPHVASGAQVTIKFVAEVIGCDDLTNDFSGWQSCLGETCLHEGPRSSYVILPDTVLINTNNALSPLYTCLTRTITATVRNAGLMSVYSTTVTETLPPGMVYVDGSTEYVVGTEATPPATGWVSGGEPANGPDGPLVWSSNEIANLARLYPHETVWIRFDVRAACDFEGGRITIQANYEDVCGDPQPSTASHFAMNAAPPDVSASKVGRNTTTGSTWGEVTYAEPGDTVQWRITVDNAGGSGAPLTTITDTLPPNTSYVSAIPTPTSQNGQQVVWDIGTLTATTSRVFTVTATVDSGECTDADTTNAVTATWGCPDPACRRVAVDTASLRTRPRFDTISLDTDLPSNTLHQCGGTITVTLVNDGPPAYNVTLTDTFPSGYVYSETVSASTGPDTYPSTGDNPAVWTWNTLPTGSTTLVFSVRNGSSSGDCAEPSSGNNLIDVAYDDAGSCITTATYYDDDASWVTVAEPELAVDKSPESQIADVGEVVSWTIAVDNVGDGVAYNMAVTDVVASNYTTVTASAGSDGALPTIVGNTITWTPNDIPVGGSWTAVVSATLIDIGSNRNVVTATTYCDTGCVAATAGDTAYLTLLETFDKAPAIQTGTIGSLVVFTLTASLPDRDALYEDLTLTDTLPAGLGYVSAVLTYTYDADGNDGGPVEPPSTPPTDPPGYLASDDVIWELGDLSGTVQINGVLTAVIRDIPTNVDGVQRTNLLRMTYTDDDSFYEHEDSTDVDIQEPLLHLYKNYITPYGCQALRLLDDFNDNDASGWTTTGGSWAVSNGVYQQTDNAADVSAYTGDTAWRDYSLDLMMRSTDNDHFGVIFRRQSNDTYYRFAWGNDTGWTGRRLERFNGGVPTTLASDAVLYDQDRWYHVEVRVEEARIRVYVDGDLIFDVEDSAPLLSGNIGLYNNYNQGTYFDDIAMDRLEDDACLVGANDRVTYTLTISNQARLHGYDLVITDAIPSGMSLVTYTLSSDDSASLIDDGPSPGATGVLTWSVNQLEPTSSPFSPVNHTALNLTVVLAVADGITANTVLPNQAALAYDAWEGSSEPIPEETRDYSGGSHSAAVRTVIGSITKGVTPSTATLGDVITYTILLPDPTITATLYNVTVTDELDPRLQLHTVTGPDGSVTSVGNAFTVTYPNPSIPHDAQRLITVTAVLSDDRGAYAGDVITNVALLRHSTDITISNEVDTTVVEPDLSIGKTSAPPTSSTVRAGDTITYTTRVTNSSSGDVSPAYDLLITDTLPTYLTLFAPISVSVDIDGTPLIEPADYTSNYAGGVLTLDLNDAISIPVGGVLTLVYQGRVNADVPASEDLTNTAQVSWSSLPGDVPADRDYRPIDDDATLHTPPANTLSKGVTPLTVAIGSQVVFSVTLPDPPEGVELSDVVLTDVVDSRLRIDDVSATGGASWGVDDQTVTATWTSIPTYTQHVVFITTTLRHMPTSTMGTQITNVALFNHDRLTTPVESNPVTVTILYDWGDLPDAPYPTLLSSDGARHVISPTLYLGSLVDAEGDGQPNAAADGDDASATSFGAGSLPDDDEDGVTWQPLVLGRTSTFTVTASADNGYLNGWIDFDADGNLEAGERVISGAPLSAGVNIFNVPVPDTATIVSPVYMRFRYSTQPDLSPDGAAPDGEVEDYVTDTIAYDLGDLPDTPYPTLLSSDGARHVISPTLYLGDRVDAEGDGQPNAAADGDDANATSSVGAAPDDDEDGVTWQPLVLGRTSIFTITTSSADTGYLNGWIDFDADGNLEADERVISGAPLSSGDNTFGIPVPTTATITSSTYMRFRYSTEPSLLPTGEAPDGEVEDYLAPLVAYDLGDLPQGPYPTQVISDGARHVILPTNNPTLGDVVDAEGDGQPSVDADGDDNVLSDDEDGVTFSGPLIPGESVTITVSASSAADGLLNAWLDFGGDGDLTDAGEQIALNEAITAGETITLVVPVPANAAQGITTYARFRFSTDADLTPTGLASDGEIEDYALNTLRLDYGDAPDTNYDTLYASDGGRHIILDAGNPTLGSTVDNESNGQPSVGADGDDTDVDGDDEDGVSFLTPLVPGEVATLTVTAAPTATGVLNAWLDFGADGDWSEAIDQIASDLTISAGTSATITFTVPLTAPQGALTYARFRFSSEGGLTPTGLAPDGEVEDYGVTIGELDYGDLPTGPYPTLFADDGARHVIDGVTYLGGLVDAEIDGAPSPGADGDDTTGTPDDEDGVTFLTPLMRDQTAEIQVDASTPGYLNAWIDFNGDGDFEDAGERIATDTALGAGANVLNINVPDVPISSSTYSRFRFTSYDTNGSLSPTGVASDGEIEDYVLMSLGNLVWLDNGAGVGGRNDGIFNGSEAGVPGVTVELYRYDQTPGVDTPITTTTTDANGNYLFTGLTPYTYVVHIPASEFGSGQPLDGLASSTGSGLPDDDLDQDVDENGIDDANPASNGISSGQVTLSLNDETVSEDGDANSNLTVDFGFYGGRIGDYVWQDLNHDGVQDAGETPIPGVVVDLYDAITGAYLGSDTTDGSGLYLFDDLPLGVTYTVQLSQVNFAPGGALYPYTATLLNVGSPDTDSDANPDALFNGAGYAVTTTLTSAISEDLTLDYGFHLVPELDLVKTVDPGAAVDSMPFTYTIRIENTGQLTFTALRLTDTLPTADFHFISGTGVPTDPDTISEPLLVWDDLVPVVGVLDPGDSVTVSFAVTATPGITGTYVNTATVTGYHIGGTLTDTDTAPVAIVDPAVALDKAVVAIDRDIWAPNYVTFTIAITNVGPSAIDELPLVDQYDPYYLSFEDATPYPDEDADDGLLTWNDLTAPAPNGFDRDLLPDETFHITTVFRVANDISTTVTNVATTTSAIDVYSNEANEDDDEVEIWIPGDPGIPTPVEVYYFQAEAQDGGVRVEWRTAAELRTVGFHIYRATEDDFASAEEIGYVPATGSDSTYVHWDRDLALGYYWYWLVEEVDAGTPDTYGPVGVGVGADALPYRIYLPMVQKMW